MSRSRSEVFGRPCVPSIDDLPMDVDLAVLCLPRAGVLDAIAACGRRRIGGAIVFASGFAETGDAGLAEQRRSSRRRAGPAIAVLGPNCLGFINHVDGVALCMALPEPRRDRNPTVGFIAQSGAMMLATVDVVRAKGIGYTHVISTGNEAVIGVEDFLAELIEDDATRVITLFIEHIRRPHRIPRTRRAGAQAPQAYRDVPFRPHLGVPRRGAVAHRRAGGRFQRRWRRSPLIRA